MISKKQEWSTSNYCMIQSKEQAQRVLGGSFFEFWFLSFTLLPRVVILASFSLHRSLSSLRCEDLLAVALQRPSRRTPDGCFLATIQGGEADTVSY